MPTEPESSLEEALLCNVVSPFAILPSAMLRGVEVKREKLMSNIFAEGAGALVGFIVVGDTIVSIHTNRKMLLLVSCSTRGRR